MIQVDIFELKLFLLSLLQKLNASLIYLKKTFYGFRTQFFRGRFPEKNKKKRKLEKHEQKKFFFYYDEL